MGAWGVARLTFSQVDVFAAAPLLGNPVAVVHDADGLDAPSRRRLAAWTNLSETAFLEAPTNPRADYRVAIHTPTFELPFAGHPTLGAAHAWLEAGGVPRRGDTVVQECGIGLVEIRRGEHLAFRAPPLLREGPTDERTRDEVIEVLGARPEQVLEVRHVDNGPGWVAALLDSADAVLELEPGPLGGRLIGAVGAHPTGSPWQVEVRAFFPQGTLVVEDPVTGSLNASLAPWLHARGVVPARYRAHQGSRRGRDGVIEVEVDDEGVWVGGSTRRLVSGRLDLSEGGPGSRRADARGT